MKNNFRNKNLAQAAVELAIFGAILIFLIGGLMRAGFQQSMGMNQQLRAMRMALSESWRTSQGAYTTTTALIKKNKAVGRARNSANLLILEDRLSIDSGQKYGTRDRIPYIITGGGTFSQNIMYSLDFGFERDLPVQDFIVNGQRFPLTTAAFEQEDIFGDSEKNPNNLDPDADLEESSNVLNSLRPCSQAWDPATNGTRCRVDNCFTVMKVPPGSPPKTPAKPYPRSCMVAFYKEYNAHGTGFNHASVDRFDLKLDGNSSDLDEMREHQTSSGDTISPEDFRRQFSWQWMPVALVGKDVALSSAATWPLGTAYDTIKKAVIVKDTQISLDIDGDGQEETIYEARIKAKDGRIDLVKYIDDQNGDIDPAYDPPNPDDRTGLQMEATMIATTNRGAGETGTYFEIKEGQLYDGVTGRFIRTTNRNDHVDRISRKLKLRNDTGRFCDADGNVVNWNYVDATSARCLDMGVCGLANPVEVCVRKGGLADSPCITDGDKNTKTCMDQDEKTIYIRSRIKNIKGYRWVTRSDL